jgi:hypothetical protein
MEFSVGNFIYLTSSLLTPFFSYGWVYLKITSGILLEKETKTDFIPEGKQKIV